MLQDNKIDLAVSHFGLSPKRHSVVDFLITHTKPERGQIYYRNPTKSEVGYWTMDFDVMPYLTPYHMMSYIRPYYIDSWIGVIVFFAIAPALTLLLLFYRELFKSALSYDVEC